MRRLAALAASGVLLAGCASTPEAPPTLSPDPLLTVATFDVLGSSHTRADETYPTGVDAVSDHPFVVATVGRFARR